MKYYRHESWTPGTRPYADCTQVLGCAVSEGSIVPPHFVECESDDICNLPHLYTQAGVQYFGYL